MNWTKPVVVGTAGLLFLILTAYLCGTFLGKKPFSWRNEPLLAREEILGALQGQWRNSVVMMGTQVQSLPENGKGSLMEFDKTTLRTLSASGLPLPHLDNTITLDIDQHPVWFDLTNTRTKEQFLGIIEVNQAKTRVRFMMRRATSGLGRPNDFQPRYPDDLYGEYSR